MPAATTPSGAPVGVPMYIVDVNGNVIGPIGSLPLLFAQSNNNASVPTGAGNTIIKAAPGNITTIAVTATGTGAGNVQIFDNASTNSGLVLAAFPANATAGQSFQVYGWAKLGMTAQNVLNGPVFTVYFS